MSPQEMRDFCESINKFDLKMRVRLKSGCDELVGRVSDIQKDRFALVTDDDQEQFLRYAWIAGMYNK